MDLRFCALFILSITISLGTTHIIREGEDVFGAVNQTAIDSWLLNFYDKCGETEVVDIEKRETNGLCNPSSNVGVGPYCGDEIVKRCVGDTPGCIEKRNCNFAIAVKEIAYYSYTTTTTTAAPTTTVTTTTAPTTTTGTTTTQGSTTPSTPPTTTPTTTTTEPPFDLWTRKIRSHQIKILDACHFNSMPYDENHAQKFVGVGLGVFNGETVDCNTDPTFENIKAYFFVSSYGACDMRPDLPIFPYYNITNTLEIPNPVNQFTITVSDWKQRCNNIKPRVPPTANPATNNSDFMKYFLIHYYGTHDYTQFHNYNYTVVDGFGEAKANLFIAPPAAQRATTPAPTTTTPESTTSTSAIFNASYYIIVSLFLSAIKTMT